MDTEQYNTIEAQILTLSQERDSLFEAQKPINERIVQVNTELRKLQDAKDQLKIDTFTDEDWGWLLANDGIDSDARYKFRNQQLEELELQSSGYYPETQQSSIHIRLKKREDERLLKVYEGLVKILPFIKPLSKDLEKGWKRIGIMEKTLSQYGIYTLLVGEGACAIEKTTYGRSTVLATFDTLLEALRYIQKHVYYK